MRNLGRAIVDYINKRDPDYEYRTMELIKELSTTTYDEDLAYLKGVENEELAYFHKKDPLSP